MLLSYMIINWTRVQSNKNGIIDTDASHTNADNSYYIIGCCHSVIHDCVTLVKPDGKNDLR